MTNRYLDALTVRFPAVTAIWLVGSRANGMAREDSDWDYIVFADQATLAGLKADEGMCDPKVDLLVVYDGEAFESPWRQDGKLKRGSLTTWEFRATSETEATYKSAKAATDDDWGVDIVTRRATRMWPPP